MSSKFQKFIDDLVQICLDNDGAGIAAPQVGINKRVIVVNVDPRNPRYPGKEKFPLTVLINPKILNRSKEKKEDWEGDLSADLRALVPRPVSCTVKGLDRRGEAREIHLNNDFHARVFQHEIDHLNGKMFIDIVKRKDTISHVAEWKKYWKGKNEQLAREK